MRTQFAVEPFLHAGPNAVYNPLTDRTLEPGTSGYAGLRAAIDDCAAIGALPAAERSELAAAGWIVEPVPDPSRRFHLKYVSLETHTVCNQACYFCPVSVAPRGKEFMPMDLFKHVVAQLAPFNTTIEGVSTTHYNEATLDKTLVEKIAILKAHDLAPALLTNGTGLTPVVVDRLADLGGLKYVSVNLSTLDPERYRRQRKADHLGLVLENLAHLRDHPLADRMDIAVLGSGDAAHRADHRRIMEYFANTCFSVRFYEVMNRAGNAPVGNEPADRTRRLCGCEQTGSRPLQWVHIIASGQCVFCCQDYAGAYIIGDLKRQSLREILSGPEMARLRARAYGLEPAPDDFICHNCVYARTR